MTVQRPRFAEIDKIQHHLLTCTRQHSLHLLPIDGLQAWRLDHEVPHQLLTCSNLSYTHQGGHDMPVQHLCFVMLQAILPCLP